MLFFSGPVALVLAGGIAGEGKYVQTSILFLCGMMSIILCFKLQDQLQLEREEKEKLENVVSQEINKGS